MATITLPTWVTLTRLFAVPILLVGMEQPGLLPTWVPLVVFLLAAATDWLDGWLARRLNQVSDLGKVLDPLVDKLLVLAPLLVLVAQQVVPTWAVFLILARELTIAGWRVNQPKISGANLWGKLKTVVQIACDRAVIATPQSAFFTPRAGLLLDCRCSDLDLRLDLPATKQDYLG
uniref:CDP-diacylglycerol--glycerol-3-phosphate 3-phosphatidyltransferase n=1 Tax=Synechococcus elongatus (strain ATCC 33912 / PCC 7942 / FACHB-805) TaxID=1140 RepID=Q8GJL6_SYNE7|nr:PgsA [Synechococcus elongatus PCC 7942 = FACHB-805]